MLIEFAISGKWQPCNNVYAEIMFWLSRRRRFTSGVWSEREHYGKYVLNSSNGNLMMYRSNTTYNGILEDYNILEKISFVMVNFCSIFNIICENLAVIELEQIFGIKCGDSS